MVLCSLTNNHYEFLESPVPIMIGFWGSQKRCEKFSKHCQKRSPQHSEILTTMIDLENICLINSCPLTIEDFFVLEKLESYLWKYGRGENLSEKISNVLSVLIRDMQKVGKFSEWMDCLRNKIKTSQMYHVFSHS